MRIRQMTDQTTGAIDRLHDYTARAEAQIRAAQQAETAGFQHSAATQRTRPAPADMIGTIANTLALGQIYATLAAAWGPAAAEEAASIREQLRHEVIDPQPSVEGADAGSIDLSLGGVTADLAEMLTDSPDNLEILVHDNGTRTWGPQWRLPAPTPETFNQDLMNWAVMGGMLGRETRTVEVWLRAGDSEGSVWARWSGTKAQFDEGEHLVWANQLAEQIRPDFQADRLDGRLMI